MKITIVFASKGKAVKEIADSLAYYAKAYGQDVTLLQLTDIDSISIAENAVLSSEAIAFGSPTYDNGKPLPEISWLFDHLINENVGLHEKKIMLFGAYGWGNCESVDYMLSACQSLHATIFEKHTIVGKIGLRLHTKEILIDDTIEKYLQSFLEFCGNSGTVAHLDIEKYPRSSFQISNSNLETYRVKLQSGSFDGVSFDHCVFRRFDFSQQTIKGASFRNCVFWYSKFDNSSLCDIEFENCDLSNCSFQKTSFIRTELSSCDLSESRLFDCDFLFADIRSVNFHDCSFDNTSEKQLKTRQIAKRMIEKQEKARNYYAASIILKKLYLNAKQMNDDELAELFYYRLMENQRKFYFHQSIIYNAFLKIILFLYKVTARVHFKKLSGLLYNRYTCLGTQTMPRPVLGGTMKFFLLVLLKLVTGNRNSIARLASFACSVIVISGAILFLLSINAKTATVQDVIKAAVNSLRRSLFYIFGIGSETAPTGGTLTLAVYYVDSIIGIIVSAFFGYILIEKLDK